MTPEQQQRTAEIQERRTGMDQFGPLSVGSTPGSHRSFVIVKGDVGSEAICGVAGERNNAKAEFFVNAPADIDFLLSVVKSQEAVMGRSTQETAENIASITIGKIKPDAYRALVEMIGTAMEDRSTAMRSACVERAERVGDEVLAEFASELKPDGSSFSVLKRAVVIKLLRRLRPALESVTLQDQEAKQ